METMRIISFVLLIVGATGTKMKIKNRNCGSSVNRRRLMITGLAFTTMTSLGAKGIESASDVSAQSKGPLVGLTSSFKLRKCSTPNCISTSDRNPGNFMSAWRAKSTQASETATEIIKSMLQLEPSTKIADQKEIPKGEYLRFAVPSPTGFDDVEFIVSNEGVPERGFDGDFPGNLVLFRSLERSPKFIYPFQTPIGDLGRQRTRLEALRQAIGARVVGCELIECYDTRLT